MKSGSSRAIEPGFWRSSSRFTQRQRDGLALLLIAAVAAALRLWQLNRFPPGLFGDEAVNGLDALDVLAGRPAVFFPANYGREGLHMLILAPFIRWLGATALALRLPSAIAGFLTTLATYWLGRELLAHTRFRGTLVALLAALFLATSYWHLHFSRFGIRGVFTPLMATLAFAAFWRGARHIGNPGQWPWFLLAGFFLGLGVHFYTASRLVPVFLGGYLIVQWLLAAVRLRRGQRQATLASDSALLRAAWWPIVAMYAMAALVFAPLELYFLRTPGSFARRASSVSLFNPQVTGGNPWARLVQAIVANLLQFFMPGQGDQAVFYNLPGRPVFDLITALLALTGLLICLQAVARSLTHGQPAREADPLLFLVLWFPAMLLPAFLAVDRFPTLPRALGVLPGIYFFPALALGWLMQRARSRERWPGYWPRVQPAGCRGSALISLLVVAVLAWHGGLTWHDYFGRWAPAAATFDAFEGDVAAAAAWLTAHPGQEVYLSADIYRHPTLVYLYEQRPLTEIFTYYDPRLHMFDGRQSLPLPAMDQATTYLFTFNAGPDPLLAHLPGWSGFSRQSRLSQGGQPALTVAQLDAMAVRAVGEVGFRPADVRFSPHLRLAGYQVRQTDAGKAAIYLLWRMDGPDLGQPHGFQVQVGLQAPASRNQLVQVSGHLGYRATEWVPGGRAITWLVLPWPEEVPAGTQLAIRVVNPANGAALRPAAADSEGWLLLPR